MDYGGQPYYCPNGWRRFALDCNFDRDQFKANFGRWPVAYHGTSFVAAKDIIINGFKSANNQACFISKFEKAVFLTPSIVYAGHPRYAKVKRVKNMNGEERFVQLALQIKVQPDKIVKRPGTVENSFSNCQKAIDRNFDDNDELEWVFKWNRYNYIKPFDGLIVYGVMISISAEDPKSLMKNEWWEESRERLHWDRY